MTRLSLARLLAATALLLPASVLAQRPDEEPYFMGWYLAPDSTEAINCATDEVHTTLTADRNYAACCKSGDDCQVATSCFGTTIYYNDNSTVECSGGNYCMSFTILQSYPNGRPSAVQLWCNTFWRAHTVYKELSTAAGPTPAATTVTVTTTAIPEATVTHTSPIETATPGASNEGEDGGSAGSSNKAWVAGAVIGPVAAIGLIGLAF
jgi:hypothetical protein